MYMEKLFPGFDTTHLMILLGAAVFLAIFYWQRFNSWTLKEISDFDNANLSPPRYFTKWSSFLMYAATYVCIVEIANLLLIWLFHRPILLTSLYNFFGIGDIPDSALKSLAIFSNSTLMSLWILTGVIPIFPGLNKIELYLRERLHEKALIPEEANSVVADLQLHETKFHPSRSDVNAALPTEFLKKYGTFSHEDSRPSPTVRHKWFKLIYLYFKLREWAEGMRTMRCATPAYKVFTEELEKLRQDVQEYLAQAESDEGEQRGRRNDLYLQRLERDIDGKITELLASMYRFISCAVYATERWPQGTRHAFRRFGLHPRLEIHVPFDWDTLLESGGAVLLSTLFPTLAYFFFLHDIFPDSVLLPKTTLEALVWSILAVLAHGLAIIAALIVFRLTTRQSKFGSRFQATIRPSAARMFLIACAGYAGGLLTFAAYQALEPGKPLQMVEISLWALLPATTAAFIGYHLDHFVYATSPGYSRLNGALRQCIVTMLVSVLVVVLLHHKYSRQSEFPYFVSFAALVAGLIGAGIGYTFPAGYKRNLRGYAGEDRRKTGRILHQAVPLQAQLTIGDEKYITRLVDLSTHGAALEPIEISTPNETVELSIPDIPDLDNVKAVLGRQEENRSFFRFLPDQRAIDQIQLYIAARAIEKSVPI
jgi:hypothetical protein